VGKLRRLLINSEAVVKVYRTIYHRKIIVTVIIRKNINAVTVMGAVI